MYDIFNKEKDRFLGNKLCWEYYLNMSIMWTTFFVKPITHHNKSIYLINMRNIMSK